MNDEFGSRKEDISGENKRIPTPFHNSYFRIPTSLHPFLGSHTSVSTQSHGNLNSSAGSYGCVCRLTTRVSGEERAFQPCITPGGITSSVGRCIPITKLFTWPNVGESSRTSAQTTWSFPRVTVN